MYDYDYRVKTDRVINAARVVVYVRRNHRSDAHLMAIANLELHGATEALDAYENGPPFDCQAALNELICKV